MTKRWGTLLKLLRVACGMSQEEMGLVMCVDRSFLSRVESDKIEMSLELVAEWTRVCGGRRLIDQVIAQLQSLRRLIDSLSAIDDHQLLQV